jgi:hypothetical protein
MMNNKSIGNETFFGGTGGDITISGGNITNLTNNTKMSDTSREFRE